MTEGHRIPVITTSDCLTAKVTWRLALILRVVLQSLFPSGDAIAQLLVAGVGLAKVVAEDTAGLDLRVASQVDGDRLAFGGERRRTGQPGHRVVEAGATGVGRDVVVVAKGVNLLGVLIELVPGLVALAGVHQVDIDAGLLF